MEENNQEIQEQDQTTEALLEPTPYRNKYKKDLDKEETEDTATVSKDTSDEDATPDEERPVDAEEKVFKKRYDDLKRHYDSTLVKHKEQVNSLESQLKENVDKINLPKTKDEVNKLFTGKKGKNREKNSAGLISAAGEGDEGAAEAILGLHPKNLKLNGEDAKGVDSNYPSTSNEVTQFINILSNKNTSQLEKLKTEVMNKMRSTSAN